MTGRIMTARQAKKHYGFPSMDSIGANIALKNTSGKTVIVGGNDPVYHRGNQNFGLYDDLRDAHRRSSGSDPKHIGFGPNRHKDDKKKSRWL